MSGNMHEWIGEVINSPVKKPMPVLSYPAVSLMNITVRELLADSDRQAEAMKLIASRTDTAAAFGFMDLSAEAECFGAGIKTAENEVPTVAGRLISDINDIGNIKIPAIGSGRTGIYLKAIEKAACLITDRPVFGNAIGPFSLVGRLMDITEAIMNCYDYPDRVKELTEKCTDFIISYCDAFKAAGADGVILAEPLAGILSPEMADEFSSPYVRKITNAVQDENFIVIYHNCGNNTVKMITSILSTGASAYHFGNAIKMADILKFIPKNVPVLGNIDPAGVLKNGSPQSVREATLRLLCECEKNPNFIISSGCDIPSETPWKNIDEFLNAVKEYYKK